MILALLGIAIVLVLVASARYEYPHIDEVLAELDRVSPSSAAATASLEKNRNEDR